MRVESKGRRPKYQAKGLPSRGQLNRKYHYLLKELGINEDGKLALLSSWGVSSSTELSDKQLYELTIWLNNKLTERSSKAKAQEQAFHRAELDKWRKRVIASVGAWLKLTNQPCGIEYIKATACQGAEVGNFNKIGLSKLRSLYNEFGNKVKVQKAVKSLTQSEEDKALAEFIAQKAQGGVMS
ncbi:MAG: hypothetical protein CSB01_01450 [Bacteroidia bacterium]|nr:MAG: hypothetical protein CSB01_01450 [Bacteroidia bacterium]